MAAAAFNGGSSAATLRMALYSVKATLAGRGGDLALLIETNFVE